GDRLERLAVDGDRSEQADAVGFLFLGQVATLEGFDKGVHLAEWRDAGDGLLAEGPGVSDGPQKLVFDVDLAAANAGDDAGLVQAEAGQAGQDQVAAWAGVLENAQDFSLESLYLRALHDSPAMAFHAGADVIHLPVGTRFGPDVGGPGEK